MSMNPGERIRRLRRRLGWTLKQTAERCDCTESLISKIETGKVMPAVATLARLAAALGVSVSQLLAEESADGPVFVPASANASEQLVTSEQGYRFRAFAPQRSEKLMQPLIFEAQRGKAAPAVMKHDGEEFIYVLTGRMNYRVGERQFTLGPGDGLYFDAWQPHQLEPLTKVVRFLAVFVEPSQARRVHIAPASAPRKLVSKRRATVG
ncbi:MAG TPA: helix-turn-helix domain-containing protein [Tepidisphaeraceae bacterium]|jgi:transcriptional regulator with XRE-family HTH domain|nr:helix-turn-helix domain-containing protein [Tepidisphaeraceae bacterium]